ncbi:hypothetical protein FRB99_006012 [Tulasnella sp. 403]|nr:hypothetical protein FRB99_006012 [Tulasnella sp. 403]
MAATDGQPIILYDIPSKHTIKAWSPNMWRTRLALNVKGLPYRTEWISYPDIESTFIKLGFKPTGIQPVNRPLYTCPAILDPTTPVTPVADSLDIALYLDTAYPNHGTRLFPEEAKSKQLDFVQRFQRGFYEHLVLLMLPSVPEHLEDPRGAEYFIRTRKERRGYPLTEMCPAGSPQRQKGWDDLKNDLDVIAAIYDENVEGQGEYFVGTQITYPDICLAAAFLFTKLVQCDQDGPQVTSVWEMLQRLNGGRWAKLLAKFDGYLQVH